MAPVSPDVSAEAAGIHLGVKPDQSRRDRPWDSPDSDSCLVLRPICEAPALAQGRPPQAQSAQPHCAYPLYLSGPCLRFAWHRPEPRVVLVPGVGASFRGVGVLDLESRGGGFVILARGKRRDQGGYEDLSPRAQHHTRPKFPSPATQPLHSCPVWFGRDCVPILQMQQLRLRNSN